MLDPNPIEVAAMHRAGDVAGQYIDKIGKTDLLTYTRAEWHDLIVVTCGAYVDAMMQQQIDANIALSDAHRQPSSVEGAPPP
jgi:hypothetical protein